MRHRLIGAFFCLFAVWIQVLAPVAAATPDVSDPFASALVICSHAATTPDDDGSQPVPVGAHHHCGLCQIFVGGGLLPERPAFAALDYPVSSPLRWTLSGAAPKATEGRRPGQPRGPPILA